MRTIYALFAVAMMVAIVGCKKEPPPPPPPPPPPEPSPEQQYGELKSAMSPLFAEGPMALSMIPPLVSSMGGIKAQKSATENGRAALAMFQRDVEDKTKESKDASKWNKVKAGCQVLKVLQPGSDRYTKMERDADLMIARPSVMVTGFVESGSEVYVFIDITDPITKAKSTAKVREGEEFYKPAKVGDQPNTQNILRLVRIVGNQQAVEIEYRLANFVWEVPGPRTRDR